MRYSTHLLSACVIVAVVAAWAVAPVVSAAAPEGKKVDAEDRPLVALWRQHDGLARSSEAPYLRFAIWADGRVLYAANPEKWGHELRQSKISPTRVARVEAALVNAGVFGLKGTCYLVPDAVEAAERLRRLEQTDLNFIRLEHVRIDSPRFREHVASLSTDHADYENSLTFVQPPKVEVGFKRIGGRTYKFDVSETVVMNSGAKIINVQWDFDYEKRFSSTPGYSFVGGANKEPQLQAQYEFPSDGSRTVACKVQDDMGGEWLWTAEIEVS